MCFPPAVGAIAGLAMSAAQAVAGFGQQQQNYQAEEQRYQQNYAAALSDNRLTETRLQEQEMENNAQYAKKSRLSLIEAAQKQGTVAATAATGGVTGNSVQAIVNGIGGEIAQKQATLQDQWQYNVSQSESEKVSAVAQEVDRMNSVAAPTPPSPAGALLSVAGAGLKFAGSSTGQSFFGGSTSGLSSTTPTSTPSLDTSSVTGG